ncbi:hypothetical protein K503DRAFT_782910 [Rhizopogon vinicolor AM-OR11-026]|uniref:Uncharacterized protein n=1 Tax=Rhizopogon vinicolor AM-OR11-026 TaxID=1314800 RepID=A0A1B7N0N5_9AGAM|nr:hypothetical protein K503DRAFT_782910 [Rhizopogon vinicolor AM-OR11-026]
MGQEGDYVERKKYDCTFTKDAGLPLEADEQTDSSSSLGGMHLNRYASTGEKHTFTIPRRCWAFVFMLNAVGSVELVGNTTRIPAMHNCIQAAFVDKPLHQEPSPAVPP